MYIYMHNSVRFRVVEFVTCTFNMLKALETLGKTLNDTEWKSKMNNLMNLLDSKDWEVNNPSLHQWSSHIQVDNIQLELHIHLSYTRDDYQTEDGSLCSVPRTNKFSKAHEYYLVLDFKARQNEKEIPLLIEDVFQYKFGLSLSLNTINEVNKAIRRIEEIETFFLSNPHDYSFDSVEDLFECRKGDDGPFYTYLIVHKDKPPVKCITREEGINLVEWEDGSVDPLANIVLGWGENSDEAWRMAHARWWSLTSQDRDAFSHGSYILGV